MPNPRRLCWQANLHQWKMRRRWPIAAGSKQGKMIRITPSNGKSVTAKVVDMHGCDKEHAGQPPCDNNNVDGSDAAWSGLGLDKDIGVDVWWT
ncbi:hypothetical protein L1049_013988 [Liquidambar formosana]|uniref:Uncharacterized protein n=1 Tax=Liquidambar formosana TaxID=63359 RepID=A0AAP0WZ82_LIQFO